MGHQAGLLPIDEILPGGGVHIYFVDELSGQSDEQCRHYQGYDEGKAFLPGSMPTAVASLSRLQEPLSFLSPLS